MLKLILLLASFQHRVPPVPIEIPLTYTKLVCPEGYKLWFRQQEYITIIPGTTNMFRTHYRWYLDSEGRVLSNYKSDDMGCFANNINPNDLEAK